MGEGRYGEISARRNYARCISRIWKRLTSELLFASAQRPAGEERHAHYDMDDVIHLAKHQERADIEHMISAGAQEPAAQAQRQIDQTEQKTESARASGRSGKTKIQSDQSGDDMDRVMRRIGRTNVGSQGVQKMSESQDSYQQQNQTQKFTNSLRHDFLLSPAETVKLHADMRSLKNALPPSSCEGCSGNRADCTSNRQDDDKVFSVSDRVKSLDL